MAISGDTLPTTGLIYVMIEKDCGHEVLYEPVQYCCELVHVLILIDNVQRLVDRTVPS